MLVKKKVEEEYFREEDIECKGFAMGRKLVLLKNWKKVKNLIYKLKER